MNIPVIPIDKANHLVYGAVLGLVGAFAALAMGRADVSREAALVAAGVGGAAKESIDWYLNRRALAAGLPPAHSVDMLDFIATLAGGAAIALRP